MNRKKTTNLPVAFGDVKMDAAAVHVPIAISRKGITVGLGELVDLLCSKLLTAELIARPAGCHPDQAGMFGSDGDLSLTGVFECRKFTVGRDAITATLHSKVIRMEALKFSNRNGQVKIATAEDLAKKEPEAAHPAEELEEAAV